MPIKRFHYAHVKNLTTHTQTLRSGDGDSVNIPPSAEVRIDRKFLTWQPPSKQKIRVLSEHFIPEHQGIPTSELNKQAEAKIEENQKPVEPAAPETPAPEPETEVSDKTETD